MTYLELLKKIMEVSHITGSFKLRSGVMSDEYFDKYQFESDPQLLINIGELLSRKIPKETEVLAGLEIGGIPIATTMGLMRNIPMVFVRKKAKEYGTAKLVEGTDIKDKNLLIVEDVVTSGGQIILSANELRNLGATINTAVCVIDREQGGKEALKEQGIELISLFTMSELKNNAIDLNI